MSIVYLSHGGLAPHLAKHPGLFGFYNKTWYEDGIAASVEVDDEHCDPIADFNEETKAPARFRELLPPIDFGNFDTSLVDSYDEGASSSESDSDSTPRQTRTPEDWFIGESSLSRLTTTVRRAPATRIRRAPQRKLNSTGSWTSPIVTKSYDFDRLDRLVGDVEQAIKGYCRLKRIRKSTATDTVDSIRQRLHGLRQYCEARSGDLLLPESHTRFHCPHQLFPSIRPPTHPLHQSPSNRSGTEASISLAQAIALLRPMVRKLNLSEELVSDIIALHSAERAVKHLASELASNRPSCPTPSIKTVTPAAAIARNYFTLRDLPMLGHSKATSTQLYVSMESSPSLAESHSCPVYSHPTPNSHETGPKLVPQGHIPEYQSAEIPTRSPYRTILNRATKLAQLADTLDANIEEAVQRSGLKAHQHTIVKKTLEGMGYLPVTI